MKRILFFFLSISFFLIFLWPLFHAGIYTTHDGIGHIVRIASYVQSIKAGTWLVRWAGDLNYSFGLPIFIFYYPFPYYFGAFVSFLHISFETTLKLLFAFAFIGSFATFFLWSSTHFKKDIALVSSIFYVLLPYHLLDLYIRGDMGELFAFVFIPLILYFIDKMKRQFSLVTIVGGAISYGLLILSHNGMALMFSPVLCIYSFVGVKKYSLRYTIHIFSFFLLGLGVSAFFWIPALLEQQYILYMLQFDYMYKTGFPTFLSLLFSPLGFGAEVNQIGGLSPQVGPFSWLIAVVAIGIFIWHKKIEKSHILFWLLVFVVGIFLALPFSNTLYVLLPLLRKFQFPWRFVALSSFAAASVSGIVFSSLPKKVVYAVVAILLLFSLLYVRVQGYTTHPDTYYLKLQDFTFYHGEAIPRWTSGNQGAFPKSPLEIIGGQATIGKYKRLEGMHSFTLHAITATTVLDNTTYYPGWNVYVDNIKTTVEFQDINHRGLITFRVGKGIHDIRVVFEETKLRIFSDVISLLSMGIITFIVFLFVFHKKLYAKE